MEHEEHSASLFLEEALAALVDRHALALAAEQVARAAAASAVAEAEVAERARRRSEAALTHFRAQSAAVSGARVESTEPLLDDPLPASAAAPGAAAGSPAESGVPNREPRSNGSDGHHVTAHAAVAGRGTRDDNDGRPRRGDSHSDTTAQTAGPAARQAVLDALAGTEARRSDGELTVHSGTELVSRTAPGPLARVALPDAAPADDTDTWAWAAQISLAHDPDGRVPLRVAQLFAGAVRAGYTYKRVAGADPKAEWKRGEDNFGRILRTNSKPKKNGDPARFDRVGTGFVLSDAGRAEFLVKQQAGQAPGIPSAAAHAPAPQTVA